MRETWHKELLEVLSRDSANEEDRFLRLVDEAEGNVDIGVARTLLQTYQRKPDYGTQERVESVLATGEPKVVARAVLLEMPRLAEQAPGWAEILLGQELEHRPLVLRSLLSDMPTEVAEVVRQIASREEFKSFYANTELLYEKHA